MSAIAAFHVTPGQCGRVAARVALVAIALWAVDSVADVRGPAVDVSTSTLPRFDTVGGGTQSSRLDLTLMPQQRSALGFSFGVNNATGVAGAFATNPAAGPSLDLGVHWRYMLDGSHRFDVTAYRRLQNNDAISMIESHEPSYGARVEMGFASAAAHKGFVADRGFIGFQLESGARLTVKKSGGVPMLYYRNQF